MVSITWSGLPTRLKNIYWKWFTIVRKFRQASFLYTHLANYLNQNGQQIIVSRIFEFHVSNLYHCMLTETSTESLIAGVTDCLISSKIENTIIDTSNHEHRGLIIFLLVLKKLSLHLIFYRHANFLTDFYRQISLSQIFTYGLSIYRVHNLASDRQIL